MIKHVKFLNSSDNWCGYENLPTDDYYRSIDQFLITASIDLNRICRHCLLSVTSQFMKLTQEVDSNVK